MISERSRFVGELDTDGDGHLNDDEVINYLHPILSLHFVQWFYIIDIAFHDSIFNVIPCTT